MHISYQAIFQVVELQQIVLKDVDLKKRGGGVKKCFVAHTSAHKSKRANTSANMSFRAQMRAHTSLEAYTSAHTSTHMSAHKSLGAQTSAYTRPYKCPYKCTYKLGSMGTYKRSYVRFSHGLIPLVQCTTVTIPQTDNCTMLHV